MLLNIDKPLQATARNRMQADRQPRSRWGLVPSRVPLGSRGDRGTPASIGDLRALLVLLAR